MSSLKTFLGLMSGTSLDGVDVALLHTDGERDVRAGPGHFTPYNDGLQTRIRTLMEQLREGKGQVGALGAEMNALEAKLTQLYSDAIDGFLHAHDKVIDDIDAIGLHGQTVFHNPSQRQTMQLGDGKRLADRFQTPVVYDFRSNDVMHGGQGAPLVPVFVSGIVAQLRALGALNDKSLLFLNLGGVANITYVPPSGEGDLIAFDTGPGNGLLNDWMLEKAKLPMDKDGVCAAKGQVQGAIVNAYRDHAYLAKPYPKSLDRLDFDLDLVQGLSVEDGAATLTEVTANMIAHGLQQLPTMPEICYVSGGGRYNATSLQRIEALSSMRIHPIETLGWSSDYLEAHAFGYLAARRLANLPISFPLTTGASAPLIGGVIANPK